MPTDPAASPAQEATPPREEFDDVPDWMCRLPRSHGPCNTMNGDESSSCGACGEDRPAAPSAPEPESGQDDQQKAGKHEPATNATLGAAPTPEASAAHCPHGALNRANCPYCVAPEASAESGVMLAGIRCTCYTRHYRHLADCPARGSGVAICDFAVAANASASPEASAPGECPACRHERHDDRGCMHGVRLNGAIVMCGCCWGSAREASTAPGVSLSARYDGSHTLCLAIEDGLRATVAALTADRDALRDVVESFALVERHAETRANGCSDLYRMPFAGSSWFDSREAAVTDWLRAPRGTAR